MRTFVIGDIHGAYKALVQVLERAGFDYENDKLISLGDVTDGWSETAESIEELMKIKNLVYIKGNHDEDKIFYMGVALEIAYENSPKVIIDNTRLQRKYYKYGQNLFGFAHGDKEKKTKPKMRFIVSQKLKYEH